MTIRSLIAVSFVAALVMAVCVASFCDLALHGAPL